MNENKLKHLEFIQNTITRMSTNSFIIKGWVITIVSALFALSNKDSDNNYIAISYFAIPVFWFLDTIYLQYERKYRNLYNEVRKKDNDKIDFNMNISNYNTKENSLVKIAFSNSIFPIYLFMLLVTTIVMCYTSI